MKTATGAARRASGCSPPPFLKPTRGCPSRKTVGCTTRCCGKTLSSGPFVASLHEWEDLDAFFVAYREKLMTILKNPASRKNHTNVLMHIQGYFRNQLNTRQRGELRDVILHYRNGQLPILAPITLLKHYLAEYPDRYLMTQNYFDPYPDDLGLRLAVK